jgi:hypothetical protein
LSRHPYRDAGLVHGALAVVIAVLGVATSVHVARTIELAGGYFVLATGWTWWRLRTRQRREGEEVEAR